MILSTNFLNKPIVILAVVFICLSGCSKVNEPVVRETHESFAAVDYPPIAILPIYNLSGTPAPLKNIKESLINNFKKRGLNILDESVLENFILRQRIRFIGGLDPVNAKVLKNDTRAEAVLITSLELYNVLYPPKIALTARLVSTDDATSVLWMEDVGLSGDDHPGILGLGRVENPQMLLEMAVDLLSDSLAGYLSSESPAMVPVKKRKKFQPKLIYRSPVLSSDIKYRIAVLPFFNLSGRKYAGEIIALHFVKQILSYENFYVIEPGAVREAFLGLRVIMDDGLSLANADLIFSRLGADLVITGKVIDYQDYQGPSGTPKVDFSTLLIERKSREVVWSSKSYNQGDDGVFFFDLGKVNTAHTMASEMVNQVVTRMLQP